MKKSLIQISLLFSLLVFIVIGSGFTAPPKAHAQATVADFLSELWGGLTTAGTNVSAAAQTALGVKTFSTEVLAKAILKIILQQLTMSIVNWINNGFQGSPSFVTNPSQFFLNMGDQIAGSFLQADGDLKFLCSPFSLDVRLALALKMQGGMANQYSCTLSSAIKNATNAVNNFTISGFIQGDFRQGGWPAFISLTTVPANNPNGAFLKAKNDLEQQIAAKTTQKTNELLQGAGFLSSEKCDYYATDSTGQDYNITQDEYTYQNKTNDAKNTAKIYKENCVTTTPGSVISGTLQKALNVPTDELLLAQDIDAIITAAFSQLAYQTLKLGLSAISTSDTGDGANYLQQIQDQSAADFKNAEANVAKTVTPFIATEKTLKANADTALGLATTAQSTLNAIAACYTNAINTASTTISAQAGIIFAQSQIFATQQIITNAVAPLVFNLSAKDTDINTTLQSFIDLQKSITTAANTNALSGPTQTLNDLSTNGGFPTTVDVQSAKNALSDLHDTIDPLQKAANTWLQQCQSFKVQTYVANSMIPTPISYSLHIYENGTTTATIETTAATTTATSTATTTP